MRTLILLSFAIISLAKTSFAQSEISLYDKDGNASAYIATNDDWTIYLWDGKPVAYIVNDGQTLHIYGFNGKHLGWYINGIIRAHDGNAVGFKKGAVTNIYEKYESYKGYKEYKPYKSYREFAPYQPYFSAKFSPVNLSGFLYQGIGDETTGVNRQVYKAPDPIMETDLDLLAKVNLTKQALFDQRTKNVQETINQISYYLKEILKYDTTEYVKQSNILKSDVNIISTTRVDYSDINQYNQIITPLNSHLNIVQVKLRELHEMEARKNKKYVLANSEIVPSLTYSTVASFQLVIQEFKSKTTAQQKMDVLKMRGHNVDLKIKNSNLYQIVLTVNRPLSDTTYVCDSLKRWYLWKSYLIK